jgi:hypothetical protein
MQAKDLKPLGSFAQFYGVKIIGYGPGGSGKSPVANSAPRPVYLAIESGLLSMRESKIPAWQGSDLTKINEFFTWLFSDSKEVANYDTVIVDSISEWAELILAQKMKTNSHGLKAYGEMAEEFLKTAIKLAMMPRKHMYLIAKETTISQGGAEKRRPYYPGKEIYKEMDHKFDEILNLNLHTIPGVVGQQKAFCTGETFDIHARDRSGKLNMYEPPDLGLIINKCMSQ